MGRSNRLAQYIAEGDAWYRRAIYFPHCRGHPTVPHLIVPSMPNGSQRANNDGQPGGSSGARPLEPIRQMVRDAQRPDPHQLTT